MPKIIWEGNKKDFGTYHDCDPIPENAVKLREAEGFIGKAMIQDSPNGLYYYPDK